MSASDMPAVGDVIADRYELVEVLGKGGFGVVYRARQDRKPREVALKVMAYQSSSLAVEPDEMKRRFRREAIMASNLIHPHAVRQFDFGDDDEYFYLAMELVQGDTLSARIEEQGTLSTELIARVGYAALDVLSFAHQRDIVHRDLKPENIMLCEVDGQQDFPKVLDFGAAKTMHGDHDLTMQGMTLGSPAYMSPEVLMDEPPRPASDLYSLGLTLAEAVVGHQLVAGDTPVEQLKQQISPHPINVPVKLIQHPLFPWLAQAIEKDVSKRFSSAQEMLTALKELDLEGIDLSSDPNSALQEAPATVPMTAVITPEDMAADTEKSIPAAVAERDDATELIELSDEVPDDASLDELLGKSAGEKGAREQQPDPTEMIDLNEEQPDFGGPEPTEMFEFTDELPGEEADATELFDRPAQVDKSTNTTHQPNRKTPNRARHQDPPTEMIDYNPDEQRNQHRAINRGSSNAPGAQEAASPHQAPTEALPAVGAREQRHPDAASQSRQSQPSRPQSRPSQQPRQSREQGRSQQQAPQTSSSSSSGKADYSSFGSRNQARTNSRDEITDITELEPTAENDFMLVKTSDDRNRSTFMPALILGAFLMTVATFLIYIIAG